MLATNQLHSSWIENILSINLSHDENPSGSWYGTIVLKKVNDRQFTIEYNSSLWNSQPLKVFMESSEESLLSYRLKNLEAYARQCKLSLDDVLTNLDKKLHGNTELSSALLSYMHTGDTEALFQACVEPCTKYINTNLATTKHQDKNLGQKFSKFAKIYCDLGNKARERSLQSFILNIFIGEVNEYFHSVCYTGWGAISVEKTGLGSETCTYDVWDTTAKPDFTVIDADNKQVIIEAQNTCNTKEVNIKESKFIEQSKVIIFTIINNKVYYIVVDTAKENKSNTQVWTKHDNGPNTKPTYSRSVPYGGWKEYVPNNKGVAYNMKLALL